MRWKRSPHNISGVSAPPGNSSATALDWGTSSRGARRLRRASKDDKVGVRGSSFEARKSAHLRMTQRSFLPSQRQRDQAERADDDAPPRKKRKAVARDV